MRLYKHNLTPIRRVSQDAFVPKPPSALAVKFPDQTGWNGLPEGAFEHPQH